MHGTVQRHLRDNVWRIFERGAMYKAYGAEISENKNVSNERARMIDHLFIYDTRRRSLFFFAAVGCCNTIFSVHIEMPMKI